MTKGAWWILAIAVGIALLYEYAISSSDGGSSSTGGIGGAVQDSASSILDALASFENVDPSHNNPGAICGSYDSNGDCLGPKTFPTLAAGEAAAKNLINNILAKSPGISVKDFVTWWSSGPKAIGTQLSTTVQNYIGHVAGDLGLSPSDPIQSGSGTSGAILGNY